jgi:hypothetical protein
MSPTTQEALSPELATALTTVQNYVQRYSELQSPDRFAIISAVSECLVRIPELNRTSKWIYYTRENAEWLIESILRPMLEDRSHKSFVLNKETFHYTTRTLLNRISQAWKYACDFMDTTGEFQLLRENIRLCKYPPKGILFQWKNRRAMGGNFQDVETIDGVEESISKAWRSILDTWIENAQEEDKLELPAKLSNEDIAWLNTEYLPALADSYIWNINKGKLFIAKSYKLAQLQKGIIQNES